MKKEKKEKNGLCASAMMFLCQNSMCSCVDCGIGKKRTGDFFEKSSVFSQKKASDIAGGHLLQGLLGDGGAPHLAGPSTNLVELGVCKQLAGTVLVHVAVSAEALDGVERDLGCVFCTEEDCTCAVLKWCMHDE